VCEQPPRRDREVGGERAIGGVEEDDVEGEPHPESVDARAAPEQQTPADSLAREPGQAEQARPQPDREGDLAAEDPPPGQAIEAAGELPGIHGTPSPRAARPLPSTAPRSRPARVQTAVQGQPRAGTGLR
jgi:hypothetical protein